METIFLQTIGKNSPRKDGITEKKKAELDELIIEVQDAQFEVNQYQAIVNSLNNKVNNFQGYLAVADGTRIETSNNKKLVVQLVQSALELKSDAERALGQMSTANAGSSALSDNMKQVIDQLIYTVEMLNKLTAIVTRKKAANPLISDELVSMIATAGKDANSAVGLALTALKSTFAAEASNIEAQGAVGLAQTQSSDLYNTLTNGDGSLQKLLYEAYTTADADYKRLENALAIATAQLNEATLELNEAQINLNSLQAGLAAANAAALAS